MKKIFILLVVILLTACSGNSSYFDLEKKGIISCNDNYISKVYIKGLDENNDYYRFSLNWNQNKYGVKFFSVVNIRDDFETYTHLGKLINNSEFALKPLSRYEVINVSNGDATQSTIIITTDEHGNIIDADKTDCN